MIALSATVARAPDAFAAFATVPAAGTGGCGRRVAPRRRGTGLLGRGRSASSVAGAPLDDPGLDVFWAACCELDVPVFMHPQHELGRRGGPAVLSRHLFGNPAETGLIAARLIFAGVFGAFRSSI